MTHSGLMVAPADFAAAAPRLDEAADALRTAFAAAEGALAGYGPFWGADEEFEHGYHRDRRAAGELAADCERALRAMARRLAGAGAAYAAAEDAAAGRFGELGLRLEAVTVTLAATVAVERR